MAEFQAVNPPVRIYSAGETEHFVHGWWSADEWTTFQPVVRNPDGPGIGPWERYYGRDPWTIA